MKGRNKYHRSSFKLQHNHLGINELDMDIFWIFSGVRRESQGLTTGATCTIFKPRPALLLTPSQACQCGCKSV